MDREQLAAALTGAGFLAADDEARKLIRSAGGDRGVLESLVARRLRGEPLAWITGRSRFCGIDVHVDPGVYVPRRHTQTLARRAAARLPARGTAIDLCTGSGAIALMLAKTRRRARVVACDVDARAVACAASNGIEVYEGDLFAALPLGLEGSVDVVVASVPYVPTPELPFLQRDTFAFESTLAYDGGRDGTDVLRRVVRDAVAFLRRGGALLLELGGDQAALLAGDLALHGYGDVRRIEDEDGDDRGLEATSLGGGASAQAAADC